MGIVKPKIDCIHLNKVFYLCFQGKAKYHLSTWLKWISLVKATYTTHFLLSLLPWKLECLIKSEWKTTQNSHTHKYLTKSQDMPISHNVKKIQPQSSLIILYIVTIHNTYMSCPFLPMNICVNFYYHLFLLMQKYAKKYVICCCMQNNINQFFYLY